MKSGIISIHQPNLFPRIKVLKKIFNSDIYVCYDDVQYVRNDWQNRVFIRNYKTQEKSWLSIPVIKPNGQKSKINEIKICENTSALKMLRKKLYYNYHASLFWDEMAIYLDEVFKIFESSTYLSDFLFDSIEVIKNQFLFEKKVNIVKSSSINLSFSTEKNMHLIEIIKYYNCNSYICGSGGLNYINEDVFNKNGIDIIVQQWNEKSFTKKYSNGEWKNISFLDFWARYGKKVLIDELGEI